MWAAQAAERQAKSAEEAAREAAANVRREFRTEQATEVCDALLRDVTTLSTQLLNADADLTELAELAANVHAACGRLEVLLAAAKLERYQRRCRDAGHYLSDACVALRHDAGLLGASNEAVETPTETAGRKRVGRVSDRLVEYDRARAVITEIRAGLQVAKDDGDTH